MMLHILHLYNYVHIYIYMTHGTKLLPLASCVCVFWSFGSSHYHSFGGVVERRDRDRGGGGGGGRLGSV